MSALFLPGSPSWVWGLGTLSRQAAAPMRASSAAMRMRTKTRTAAAGVAPGRGQHYEASCGGCTALRSCRGFRGIPFASTWQATSLQVGAARGLGGCPSLLPPLLVHACRAHYRHRTDPARNGLCDPSRPPPRLWPLHGSTGHRLRVFWFVIPGRNRPHVDSCEENGRLLLTS